MKAIKGLSVLALAIALAGAAGAQPGPEVGPGGGPGFGMHRPPMERLLGPGSEGRWWNNPKVIDQLKLSDDQRKQMDQILLEHRENLIDMRANVQKSELEMEPLMNIDQPNEQAILSQIDKIAQARAELEKANARFLLAIRAKLTPDQFKALRSLREERGNQMRDRMQRWGNRRPGAQFRPGTPPGPDGAPGPGPGAVPPPAGPGDPESMLLPPQILDPLAEPGTVE